MRYQNSKQGLEKQNLILLLALFLAFSICSSVLESQSNTTHTLYTYWNIMGQYSGKNQLLYDESVSKPIDVDPSRATPDYRFI